MARIVVSFAADADTAGILSYLTNKAGRATAAKYNALFESLYDRLALHPDSGPRRPVLGPNVRIGIVPPYIVIYDHEPAANLITVLRIVDGRRRISGRLLVG
jgi:toxin ParE1/3/4